jgi:hypothetical protein
MLRLSGTFVCLIAQHCLSRGPAAAANRVERGKDFVVFMECPPWPITSAARPPADIVWFGAVAVMPIILLSPVVCVIAADRAHHRPLRFVRGRG